MTPLAEQLIVQAGVISAPPKPARPMVAEIQRVVATFYALDPAEMKSQARAHSIAHPRQVAMYLTYQLTHNTLPAIGRLFGGRDHTTVLHAKRQIERRIANPADETGSDIRAICEALADVVDARSISAGCHDANRLKIGGELRVSTGSQTFPQPGPPSVDGIDGSIS